MDAKEKALELYNKYEKLFVDANADSWGKEAKQCALLYADGIIELLRTLHKPEYTAFLAKDLYTIEETEYQDYYHGYDISEYFEEVKLEINKL